MKYLKLIRLLCTLMIFQICFSGCQTISEGMTESDERSILFFYSGDCSDCHAMKAWLDPLLEAAPELPVREICIEEEPALWEQSCKNAGIPAWGVPRIFIGDMVFAGWSKKDGQLVYIPAYYGYMGYRNQLAAAIESYCGIALPDVSQAPEGLPAPSGGGCIGGC